MAGADGACFVVFGTACTAVAIAAFQKAALEPYMDEVFHVPQAQRYCEGQWSAYGPKITTPPGLYVAAVAYTKVVERVGAIAGRSNSHDACTIAVLRSLNWWLAAGLIATMAQILNRSMGWAKAVATAVTLGLYPINFFFFFLFYTDTGSTFLLLLAYLWSLPPRDSKKAQPSRARLSASAAASCAAITFRQTNAVWALFIFGTAVLRDVSARAAAARQKRNNDAAAAPAADAAADADADVDEFGGPLTPKLLIVFAGAVFRDRQVLMWRHFPLLVPLAGFAAFLAWNGGAVVFGDKEHHVPVRHWVQPLYVLAVAVSMWGVVGADAAVAPGELHAFLRFWARVGRRGGSGGGGGGGGVAMVAIGTGALAATITMVAWVVHMCTLSHPFLLADNRHYTFYVWRRWLGRSDLPLKELLAPAYLYSAWLVVSRLRRAGRTPLWLAALAAATCLVLVPAHLIEPRYFTLPVLMIHLHAPERSRANLAAAAVGAAAVNAATIYVFLFQPIAWGDGSVARFMW
ncbi:unnamed protein product [Phaeothamnion confervicola]